MWNPMQVLNCCAKWLAPYCFNTVWTLFFLCNQFLKYTFMWNSAMTVYIGLMKPADRFPFEWKKDANWYRAWPTITLLHNRSTKRGSPHACFPSLKNSSQYCGRTRAQTTITSNVCWSLEAWQPSNVITEHSSNTHLVAATTDVIFPSPLWMLACCWLGSAPAVWLASKR